MGEKSKPKNIRGPKPKPQEIPCQISHGGLIEDLRYYTLPAGLSLTVEFQLEVCGIL